MECDKRVIGARIGRLRTSHQETQEKLAEAIGVSRDIVAKWESFNRKPKLDHLYAIAIHYSVSVDYLLGLQNDPVNDPDIKAMVGYTGLNSDALSNIREYSLHCKNTGDGSNSLNAIFADNSVDFNHLRMVLFDNISTAVEAEVYSTVKEVDHSEETKQAIKQLSKKGHILVEPFMLPRLFEHEAVTALTLIIHNLRKQSIKDSNH